MSSSIQASTSAAVNPANPPLGGGPNDYEMTERRQDGVEDEGSNDGSAEGGDGGQVDGTAEDGTADDDGTANDEAAQILTQYTERSAQDPLWFRVYRILFWPHIRIYFYLEPHLARLPEPVTAFGAFAIGLMCLFAWAFVAGTLVLYLSWLYPDREEELSSSSSSSSEAASASSFATATATATATSSTTL